MRDEDDVERVCPRRVRRRAAAALPVVGERAGDELLEGEEDGLRAGALQQGPPVALGVDAPRGDDVAEVLGILVVEEVGGLCFFCFGAARRGGRGEKRKGVEGEEEEVERKTGRRVSGNETREEKSNDANDSSSSSSSPFKKIHAPFVPNIIRASSVVLALTSISWVYRADRASLAAGSKGTMAEDTSRATTLRLEWACFFCFFFLVFDLLFRNRPLDVG